MKQQNIEMKQQNDWLMESVEKLSMNLQSMETKFDKLCESLTSLYAEKNQTEVEDFSFVPPPIDDKEGLDSFEDDLLKFDRDPASSPEFSLLRGKLVTLKLKI